MKERIFKKYGRTMLRKSALSIRNGEGVFKLVMEGRVKTALEIGTYRGVASACMAQYCDKVITIDLNNGKFEESNNKYTRQDLWDGLGIKNITFYGVNDNKEKKKLIDSLDFDFAFIDGDHDGSGPADDFKLVKRCGRVLFHDYDDRGQPALNHVYDFINSLPEKQIVPIDIFALWTNS